MSDIDPLLAQLYHIATKLALAPSPSLLRDLAQLTDSLALATRLLQDDRDGATLSKITRNHVSDIINALDALARSTDQDRLLRTATVHDLISVARGPSGIPKDNQAAVYHAWKSDVDALQDNLHEVSRIIEPEDDTSDDLNDGWDEIGLGNASNLDKVELARANNVHRILRLTTLFHKRIFLDLLPYSSSAPLSAFDGLLRQSNLLLATSDDLVAALYAPQDPDNVSSEILQLANIVTTLQTQTYRFFPPTDQLSNQLQALNLKDATTSSKKRADKKWFDTCVDQILGLCSTSTQAENATSRSSRPC